MTTIISHYLDTVSYSLKLDISTKREVIRELASHIEDRIDELRKTGLLEEEAAKACIRLLGPAKLVARQLYEAYSQGTWRQALFASLPHILFGFLFILNWWQDIGWPIILLIMVLSTAVWGWWKGKPNWLFPWLGYSLMPVIAAGLLLLYLPRALSWVAVVFYFPLALWLFYRIITQAIVKDWLYLSLMLLPIPIIAGWFVAMEWMGEFPEHALERLHYFAPWIGVSFMALGLAVVTFVRLRRRWLKISVLFVAGVTTLSLVALYAWGRLELVIFLALLLMMVSIFLVPALLENGVRSGRWGKVFEQRPMA
ncbi:MAG: permease prefix domain 1-containing protein [Dehalococcoidia bacterium]|nr:permease prefix domain 1-containing protein [Dehalococcoidia bacterium]